MRGRVERVFEYLDGLISGLSEFGELGDLVRAQVEAGRGQAEAWPEMSAVQLPLLAHAAVAGEEETAIPLAGACLLVYLGADLFDSAMDGELPAFWQDRSPAEVHLTATTMLAALPQISLGRLEQGGVSPARIWALSRLFAEALLTMGAGQHQDLLLSHREAPSLAESRMAAERKAAAASALFAEAGATPATEDAAKRREYRGFGLCLGMARQLVTDMWDLWEDGQDLRNGRRTLPLAHALTTLPEDELGRLRGVLASGFPGRHEGVRRSLTQAGSLRYTALIVWLYNQMALDHLDTASPEEPAGTGLRLLLEGASPNLAGPGAPSRG